MRMIGIGLMGFLLAGIALLLSTMNILEKGQRLVRELTTGPQLVFEHRTPALSDDTHTATLTRTNADQPVILSGFPAYQSVAFALPVDARPTSGYLQIDATAQVLEGVEGVLRISIHNTRRGELLLRPGEVGRSLQIPLSPSDLAGPQLLVSFSLKGTGGAHHCGPKDGLAASVEIETSSAVYLTLDAPLASARDRVRAWGNVVHIGWPDDLARVDQLRRIVLASELRARDVATVFTSVSASAALNTEGLNGFLQNTSLRRVQTTPTDSLLDHGASTGLRRFHRKAAWRARYDLDGAGQSVMPAQLALDMRLGVLLGEHVWSISVTLNDRLVFQTHAPGTQDRFQADVVLPHDMQAWQNTIEIVASTTHRRHGACDDGPELMAEMLPSARLTAGDTAFESPLAEIHAALRDLPVLTVGLTHALNATDAAIARDILHRVRPQASVLEPVAGQGVLTFVTPQTLPKALPTQGPAWLVIPDITAFGLSVFPAHETNALPPFGVALLVAPDVTGTHP